MFLKILQNSQENTCAKVSFLIKLQAPNLQFYFKKASSAGAFSREFYEIFTSTYFVEHMRTIASVTYIYKFLHFFGTRTVVSINASWHPKIFCM